MRRLAVSMAIAGAVLSLTAGAAEAYMCFTVIDAKDNLVYRSETSPVDLSERGAAAREAMRQRGNLLMIVDAEQCFPLGPASGESSYASAADYVGGLRSLVTAGDAARGGRGVPAPMPAAATAPAAPAPAAPPPAAPAAAPRTAPSSGGY